ncbi:MAG: hypothetical protein D6696_09940 [Acidobacteria bacterium]|nr:MAG: hypothetical protein D6696_09940 [Acidobacteriota bacterium]
MHSNKRLASRLPVILMAAALLLPLSAAADEHPAWATMAAINAQLAAQGADYQLEVIEFLTTDDSDPEFQRTVFFSDRGNKQLGHDFVPGDARRTWGSGTAITFFLDGVEGVTDDGLTQAQTDAAIRAGIAAWENLTCSTIPQIDLGNSPFDAGVVENILGFGGSPFIFADIAHTGWEPRGLFDAIAPNGGSFILAATFTFVFTGTDVDNNGKLDTAFREVIYNDGFTWAINANFDVQTVATHEHGHALSQAHFGEAFTNPSGKLFFAPRAVMNAAYSGVQQSFHGSDVGGHCSNWGSWPNN